MELEGCCRSRTGRLTPTLANRSSRIQPAAVLGGCLLDITLYRDGIDVIPTVPWPFPLPFRHVRQQIPVKKRWLNPISAHEIENYIEAMEAISGARAAAE